MNKNTNRKRYISGSAALLIAGTILLTGCCAKAPDGYYILDSVMEGDTSVDSEALATYGLNDSYAVFEDGIGYVVFMGTPEDVTFDSDKSVIHTTFGDISAKVGGSTLTLADSNISMKFTKSKDDAPAKPGYPTVSLGNGAMADPNQEMDWSAYDTSGMGEFDNMTRILKEYRPEVDWDNFDWYGYDWITDEYDLITFFNEYGTYGAEGMDSSSDSSSGGSAEAEYGYEQTPADINDFWNGYWFGYWTVDAYKDEYEQMEDYKFAVIGASEMDKAGNTEIYLWDNDYQIAEVQGTNNGYGLTEFGTFISESGYFWNGDDLEHADWNVDPGIEEHNGSILIDGVCTNNGEKQFRYSIRLVKWGYKWEDFKSTDLPDEYSWYLEQLDKGVTDPNTVDLPVYN